MSVHPEIVKVDRAVYVIKLRGTALLEEQARAWIRQAGQWRSAPQNPGRDIEVEVRRADSDEGTATTFELALKWIEDRPGSGPILWSGRYIVRVTDEGPVLEQAHQEAGASL